MPEVGRVKACTECRQQKVRCDAFKDYSQPCSRCRAGGLPCVISRDFQRRPKQSKAQLQHEIDRLRAQAECEYDSQSPSSYIQVSGQSGHKRRRGDTLSPQEAARQAMPPSAHSEPSPSLRIHMQPYSTPQSEQRRESHERSRATWSEPTLDRSLNNVFLESSQIDDCYASFLNHYAPYLEGMLDVDMNPNERYQQSVLLFWTMILVGSRGYEKDLTIYSRLGDPVLQLIFASFLRPPQPLAVIQATIIFCNWPLPVDLIYKDPAQALAGAAIGLALQQGLHMYTREQDFVVRSLQGTSKPAQYDSIKRDRNRDEAVVLRTRIWGYCSLVLQNTFIGDGLPPPSPVPCFRRSLVYDEILVLLPEMMAFRIRLHKLQVETITLISNSSDLEPNGTEPTLNAMIRNSEERILEVPLPQDTRLHRFIRKCAQVCVLGLIFLVQQEPVYEDALRLYRLSRDLISDVVVLDREVRSFTFFMPQSMMRAVFLASHIILRVPKSPLGKQLDMTDAEAGVNNCIDLFTRRAVSAIDIHSIQATVFKQLWSSKRAFVRDSKPQNGLRVDMRYRLGFNPVFDSMWWWRMEFGSAAVSSKEDSDQQQQPPLSQANIGNSTFPAHWSVLPASDPSDGNGFSSSDQQNFAPFGGDISDTFFPGASMENVFDGFMDWWDLSAFPMDTFQTDTGLTNAAALNNLGAQALFVDNPRTSFAA